MIKYLGSKRKIIDYIYKTVSEYSNSGVILDLFSGTSRVSYALKALGHPIIANDHNTYAYNVAKCYIEGNTSHIKQAQRLINELNSLKGSAGWFTQNYGTLSRYIQPHNCARIDAIREEIERKDLEPVMRSIILTALIEAADRVDSTVGLQMAYLKSWSKRSYNDLELRVPALIDGHPYCLATQQDADICASNYEADVIYLDPPYNQHSYLGNYHIWESLVLWDKPDVYGIARKRVDCKTRKSEFNSKRKCYNALQKVVENSTFNTLVMSYNNEGHMTIDHITTLLDGFGEVSFVEIDHKRHICSKIGVFNKDGVRVGESGKTQNKEYLIICKREH